MLRFNNPQNIEVPHTVFSTFSNTETIGRLIDRKLTEKFVEKDYIFIIFSGKMSKKKVNIYYFS